MRRRAIRRKPDNKETDAASAVARSDKSPIAQPKVTAATPPHASSAPAAKVPAGDTAASEASPSLPADAEEMQRNEEAVAKRIDALPSAAPPAEPLSPAERCKRTANNLTQLGKAWRAYLDDKRHFPGPITNDKKQLLLSWRVELLPYLGLQSLYDVFHLNEPWDSPHNMALLEKIPSVFQSPERFDAKTNYLALSLRGTSVYQDLRPRDENDIEDGIANTLAIVEADDEQAVPWTQPVEFRFAMESPLKSLGNLRENGLFVVWSDGQASWIDGAVDPKLFAMACTCDAAEYFRRGQIAKELSLGIPKSATPSSEAAGSAAIATVPGPNAADQVTSAVEKKRPTRHDAQASLQSKGVQQPRSLLHKQPIPSPSELKIARDLLRELFQSDYAAAKTATQRMQLARKMLDHLPDLSADVPGQYALLKIVKQISIQDGGVHNALDAADQMSARFEFSDDAWFDTFQKLTRTASDRHELKRLLVAAETKFDNYVLAERYEAAERMSDLAVFTASKAADKDTYQKFSERRKWAGEAKDLQKAADQGLAILEQNVEDPQANSDVGKFLCLIRNDWENGLVILANGNDRSWKRLAAIEIGDLSDPAQQLELADLWMREAESASPAFQATMQSRAKYWYERALPGLPAGLVRIRVERRIEQLGRG